MSFINQINPGRRPSIAEIRDYYSRDEIHNELLGAIQRWHVRFVPGYAKSRWIYTENQQELHSMIMRQLDLMEKHPQRKDYPYFRINWERHHPVIIPAEVFPKTFRGIPLKDKHKAVYHRLMVFLNKRATQRYNEHDRHCPPGTNMPYSVNEDTGLLNYPLLREELEYFRPWHASIHLAKVQEATDAFGLRQKATDDFVLPRDFWRTVPEDAYSKADVLLDEVMKPYDEQTKIYPPISHQSIKSIEPKPWEAVLQERKPNSQTGFSIEQALEMLKSNNILIRRFTAWALMLMEDDSLLPALCEVLTDEDSDVRWFAAEAMFRFGNLDAMPKLLEMQPDDMANGSFVDFCVKHGGPTIPFLIEKLKTKFQSPWSSLPIDKALERIGDASKPFLEKIKEYDDAENRQKASNILNRLFGTPSIEQILEMSHSIHHKQRKFAARMLAWYDEPQTTERLLKMVNDKSQIVRKEAVKALGCIDHPELEKILQHAQKDSNSKVRGWAKRGLERVIEINSIRNFFI